MTDNPHKIGCFAIYDTELNVYAELFHAVSHIEAKRSVSGFLHNYPDSIQALHANVYQLHHLGDFDKVAGKYSNIDDDRFVCSLIELQPKAVDKPTVVD